MIKEFPYDYPIHTEPNTGCYLWAGPVNWNGYGMITIAVRTKQRAHRLFWEMFNGPIPDGLTILHKCDTPACVNPEHLRLGTFADNMADKVQKGRQAKGPKLSAIRKATTPLGEANHASKLTDVQVKAIRADERSGRQIAADYGIQQQQVSRIKRRLRWGHLE